MLHYGTLHDCLLVAGNIYRQCSIKVNQDIFPALAEANELQQADVAPWKMIEVLVFSKPELLEESTLMEYDKDKAEGDCAYIYIESLSPHISAITISK